MMLRRFLKYRPMRAAAAAVILIGAGAAALVTAAEAEKPAAKQPPRYPHVTLSTWYAVDPDWPQKPADLAWGQMPGVAVDRQQQVWIYTRANPPVQVYSPQGKLLRTWGPEVFGAALEKMKAHFIKFDDRGMIWLADVGNHAIWQFSPDGKLLRTLGTPGEPGCDERHFDKPTDMAITPDGQVFVTDGYGNARVVHFDAQGKFVKAWGQLGSQPGEFSLPHAIVLDSQGRVYVADRNNVRVQVFDQDGKFLSQWQNLLVPWGFWILPNDEIWVCGSSPMPWRETDGALGCPPKDQVLMRFDTTGRVLQIWTVPKAVDGEEKPGELNWVHGIALDAEGNLYATDIMGQRLQKFVRQK